MGGSLNDPFPMPVFIHRYGWVVIQHSERVFRLISERGEYLASFGSKDAAISYMNNEFLD